MPIHVVLASGVLTPMQWSVTIGVSVIAVFVMLRGLFAGRK
jgi:hypothetical protein